MTVNSSANSVILILFAFSDNLSAENSKLSADSCNRRNHLFGCMTLDIWQDNFMEHTYMWLTIYSDRGSKYIARQFHGAHIQVAYHLL